MFYIRIQAIIPSKNAKNRTKVEKLIQNADPTNEPTALTGKTKTNTLLHRWNPNVVQKPNPILFTPVQKGENLNF